MRNYLVSNLAFMMLMDKAGGDGGAGGGAGGTPPPAGGAGAGGNSGGGNADTAKLIEALQASNTALLARLDKLEKGSGTNPPPEGDGDLADKVRRQREADEKKAGDSKTLETALRFTLSAPEWLKTNAALLPKTIGGIFEQAEKENYGSAIEKANSIKVGIVSEFFSQQANLDLLTENQKIALDDFKKLTKNEKQERVQNLFDSIFEPTFNSLKQIRKASQLSKGLGDPSTSESAYTDKMKKLSRAKYLKEGK